MNRQDEEDGQGQHEDEDGQGYEGYGHEKIDEEEGLLQALHPDRRVEGSGRQDLRWVTSQIFTDSLLT